MLKYSVTVFFCLSYVISAKSQLPARPLSGFATDTVFIGIQNDFHVNSGAKIKSTDKNFSFASIKDDKLSILPIKKGLFLIELSLTDSSKVIRKSFYATVLPAKR